MAHLWAILPLALAWFAAAVDYIEPFDFWWNVKSGEIMAQTGRFLSQDVLVWSPVREPYYNPQWGSQLLFYWAYSLSPYLLLTLRALIITATVGMIVWVCRRKSGSLRAATAAGLIAYITGWTNYGMRPQLFAFLPFIAFYLLLERKDTAPKWLPLLVPVMLFWVNVHGSFFLGLGLLGIYGLGTLVEKVGNAQGRRWLRSGAALWQGGWFAAAALATLANPYFIGIYNYFFVATNDPIARTLNNEWQAPTLYNGTGILFFANLLIFAASLYLSKRRMRPTELLLVLAFGYLSLTSLRNVLWWAWITAPIMAANFTVWAAARKPRPAAGASPAGPPGLPALNWLLATIIVGGALAFTPLWRAGNPLVAPSDKAVVSAGTPTKLADFLEQNNLPAPIFNYMEWGGYLEWRLYPQRQMFIDGRFEARTLPVWEDYLSVSAARADWQLTLDRYDIRTLVLSKQFHKSLIPFALTSPAWHKVYEDKLGLVLVKADNKGR